MCLLDTINVGYSEKTMLNHHVLWLGWVTLNLVEFVQCVGKTICDIV